jgi:transcriptional regulator with XRE-family HTH domain
MTETELFFKRTERLAKVLRLSGREIAKKIGVSHGSLCGYRTGRIRITNKAWAKLEAAERAAGVETGAVVRDGPGARYDVRSRDAKDVGPGGGENFPAGDWRQLAEERAATIRTLLAVVEHQAETIRTLAGRETDGTDDSVTP